MNIDATVVGQLLFINFLVMMFLTLKFAKGKADNLPLVAVYTLLINILFFPAGWVYCWYWSKKIKTVENEL